MDNSDGMLPSVEYDPTQSAYRAHHDFTDTQTITESLILVLEDVADREATSLSTTLYEVVQPSGLRILFAPCQTSPRDTGKLSFSIDGFSVLVHADGTILITPPDNERHS
jgi:hypothetical protein